MDDDAERPAQALRHTGRAGSRGSRASSCEAIALTRASAKSTGGVLSAVILNTTRPSGVAAEPAPSAGSRKIAATTDSRQAASARPRWTSVADFTSAPALFAASATLAPALICLTRSSALPASALSTSSARHCFSTSGFASSNVRSCAGSTLAIVEPDEAAVLGVDRRFVQPDVGREGGAQEFGLVRQVDRRALGVAALERRRRRSIARSSPPPWRLR